MIDPTIRNINRLFVQDFNVLIDNKPLFDQPVKNKQEAYENNVKMSRNNNYTSENLLTPPKLL